MARTSDQACWISTPFAAGDGFNGLRVAIVGTWRIAAWPAQHFRPDETRSRSAGRGSTHHDSPAHQPTGVQVYHNLDEGLRGVHVIMMLRLQLERQGPSVVPDHSRVCAPVWTTGDRVKLAEPGAIVMHPGPINRGVEIAPDVADSLSSVILDQVANGVAVRMGILYLMSGQDEAARIGKPPPGILHF